MPTADEYAWIVSKRIMGWETFKDNVLDYLRDYDSALASEVWHSSGTFTALGLAADGNDEFKITGFTSEGIVGIDGLGGFINMDQQSADVEDVFFENTNVTDYYVAVMRADLPQGIVVAQGDGLPNWDTKKEVIGWAANPNSVVNNGTTMTFVVDSVTENAVTNAGRTVAVYKTVPDKNAITESLALEEIAVVWDSPNNKITTTTVGAGGAGVFGQDSPSTTAADYIVVLLGPRVSRNTDLRTLTDWCFIGIVEGVGAGGPPTVFDVTDQNVMAIPLSDLTQITRYEGTRLKVEVKAIGGESEVPQISVKDSGANVVFSVDEDGDILTESNLRIKGTTLLDGLVTIDDSAIVKGVLKTSPGTTHDIGDRLAASRWRFGHVDCINIIKQGQDGILPRLTPDPAVYWQEPDFGVADQKIWAVYPLGGQLCFYLFNDLGDANTLFMRVDRSGMTADEVRIFTDLKADGSLYAGGDGGALVGSTGITDQSVAVAGTGDCPVTTSAGAGTPTNTEWLKIYIGANTRYIPCWTSTT